MKSINRLLSSRTRLCESLLPRMNRAMSVMNKKKEIKLEEYTTYSHFNDNLQSKEKALYQQSDMKSDYLSSVLTTCKFLLPIICLPVGLHFGYAIFDQVAYGQLSHYTLQNTLKHSFIINCIHTGILTGYKLNEERITGDITSNHVLSSYILLASSFIGVNILVFYPLGLVLFNSTYIALMYTYYKNASMMKFAIPVYPDFFIKFMFVVMSLMLVIANFNMSSYNQKVKQAGRFEEVVKFYELSSDREFKKVMVGFEEFLTEIDVKVERSKE